MDMMMDPHLAEREMALNTTEALASAKQARLARTAGEDREPRAWKLPLAQAFQSLKAFWVQSRPAHRKESASGGAPS